MDHHCPFISNCVGKRNYMSFYLFCVTLLLDTMWIFSITIVDLFRRINSLKETLFSDAFRETQKQFPLSIPLEVLTGIAMICLCLLVCLHIKLSCNNKTTSELYKDPYKSYYNYPFSMGSKIKNFKTAVCRFKRFKPLF